MLMVYKGAPDIIFSRCKLPKDGDSDISGRKIMNTNGQMNILN